MLAQERRDKSVSLRSLILLGFFVRATDFGRRSIRRAPPARTQATAIGPASGRNGTKCRDYPPRSLLLAPIYPLASARRSLGRESVVVPGNGTRRRRALVKFGSDNRIGLRTRYLTRASDAIHPLYKSLATGSRMCSRFISRLRDVNYSAPPGF